MSSTKKYFQNKKNQMQNKYIVDPHLKSWISYDASCHFPIQNIPLGIFSNPNLTGNIAVTAALALMVF